MLFLIYRLRRIANSLGNSASIFLKTHVDFSRNLASNMFPWHHYPERTFPAKFRITKSNIKSLDHKLLVVAMKCSHGRKFPNERVTATKRKLISFVLSLPELTVLRMAEQVEESLEKPRSFQACHTAATLKNRLQPFHHWRPFSRVDFVEMRGHLDVLCERNPCLRSEMYANDNLQQNYAGRRDSARLGSFPFS